MASPGLYWLLRKKTSWFFSLKVAQAKISAKHAKPSVSLSHEFARVTSTVGLSLFFGFRRGELWREALGERICGTENLVKERERGFYMEVIWEALRPKWPGIRHRRT